MKTLIGTSLLMACVVLVLMGCSDNSTPVAAPGEQTSRLLGLSESLTKMGEDMHSATGSGHWRSVGVQSHIRCSFSAVQHSDGTTSGVVQNNDAGSVFRFHGTVFDLKVEGNRAKICWVMTSGAYTLPGGPTVDVTGMVASMIVADNGDGRSATESDLVSVVWFDVPGSYYPDISMTVEQLNALEIDAYLNAIYTHTGASYETWVLPAIDQGSVKVR